MSFSNCLCIYKLAFGLSVPQVIDNDQPIRLAKFGARTLIYKAGDIHNILYKIVI